MQSFLSSPLKSTGKMHGSPFTVTRTFPTISVDCTVVAAPSAHSFQAPLATLHCCFPIRVMQPFTTSPRYVVGKIHCSPSAVIWTAEVDTLVDAAEGGEALLGAAHSFHTPLAILHCSLPRMVMQSLSVSPR